MNAPAPKPAPPSPWQHECRLNKHAPASTARLHTIPFTRVPTGAIAACPYCGSVKHTKETA